MTKVAVSIDELERLYIEDVRSAFRDFWSQIAIAALLQLLAIADGQNLPAYP